jgi:hypothetical protein
MTPSQRALKLQAYIEDVATLCEDVGRVAGGARAVGMTPVPIGADRVEELGKQIRHFLADLGPPPEAPHIDGACPECGEKLRSY